MAEQAVVPQGTLRKARTAPPQLAPTTDAAVATAASAIARSPGPTFDAPTVVALQRYLGNQEVTRLLQRRGPARRPTESEPSSRSAREAALPAGDAAQVQRVIATQPAALLVNAPASLNGRLTTIGTLITQYNVAAQNVALSQRKRMKKQFLLLRKLRRAIYGAMNRISQRTEELSADPIAQRLHALQGEADVEHRQLVQTMVNNPGLINQVTPFKTQGMNPGQVNAAKALWTSLMTGTGKVKLTGDAANQEKVQSWLTQLMDTEHGRAILASLNSADARAPLNDELTNVYIGQRPGQMPGTVTGNAAYNPMMQANPHEAQAQPLKDENATKLAAHQGAVANHNAVTNAGEFVDEVLAGNRGVQMNGAEYDFNAASTGSFVNMEESAQFPTALGSTQQVAGQQQHPEIYMPDWLLLGHELGHSANMRAGSATNARPMLGNATTNAFSAQWSGMAPQAREANWYGGSEEYINIVGNENRLRTQAGLRERAGHVSPKVPRLQQRGAAITNAFNAGAWYPNLLAPASQTLPNEYVTVQQHVQNVANLNANTTQAQFQDLLQMATRVNQFATAWIALQTARAGAGSYRRWKRRATWNNVVGSIVGIGQLIIQNNAATFNNRRQAVINLTGQY